MVEQWTQSALSKSVAQCTNEELYCVLLQNTKDMTRKLPLNLGDKRLYYISAEFLLGKILGNNLINLGIRDDVKRALESAGKDLSEIEELEKEPSLGNGGLGRLAACFLDSIATLGLPGDGVGLDYHFGLFHQHFQDRKQMEEPNPWMDKENFMEKTALSFPVQFGGFSLTAELWEMSVAGHHNGKNRLRLFDVASVDEALVTDGINFDKRNIPGNLTLFLYPDDSDEAGRLLRVYQQYFMVSAAAQLILMELEANGHELATLPDHVVIQINDTHPSMVIPELTRLLCEKGMPFEEAAAVVEKTCAYTNHTILAEALETWPMHYIEQVAPAIKPVIEQLDAMIKARGVNKSTDIIDDQNRVHMANMDIHFGFSVNGVAALHTEILKEQELKPFYDLYPEKFSNKTNGITFRRWLEHCNPRLADQITQWIGDDWKRDANKLSGLMTFKDDDAALNWLLEIKFENKRDLCGYIQAHEGIAICPDSVFDIQIKRFHEYKRQQMNALYAIYQYRNIKSGNVPKRPIVMLFGGKAAPAYIMAKDIMHVILCLQEIIRRDEEVSKWLKVIMVENYNVTYAEKLIPACDISEQISLASKEASGTGNMKFMLNGAVTLGTMDGANVEIHDLVGAENIFIFGQKSEDVIEKYKTGSYVSSRIYRGDGLIEPLVDFIVGDEMMAVGDRHCLQNVYKELVSKDWFMTLLDLRSYIEEKDRCLAAYEDRRAWAQKMITNIAMAGFFSSDRTIEQYNQDIWHLR